MSPTRRTLLRAATLAGAGLLAGCVTSGLPDVDDPTPTPTPDDDSLGGPGDDDASGPGGGTRLEGTGGPGLTLVSVDDPPALPVRPAIDLVEPVATPERPPRMRVTVTNEGDAPLTLGEGRATLFAYVTDGTGDLIWVPAGGDYPVEADCWRLSEGLAVTEEYRTVPLAPGASHEGEVELLGVAGGDGCLPVGEYRFETTYAVAAGEGAAPDEGDLATWGFTVLIE